MNESWSQGEAHCRALHSAGTLGLVRSVAELHWVRASVLLQGVPHWVGLHMVMQDHSILYSDGSGFNESSTDLSPSPPRRMTHGTRPVGILHPTSNSTADRIRMVDPAGPHPSLCSAPVTAAALAKPARLQLTPNAGTWQEAREYCNEQNMELVDPINSELAANVSAVAGGAAVWLGRAYARQPGGQFSWASEQGGHPVAAHRDWTGHDLAVPNLQMPVCVFLAAGASRVEAGPCCAARHGVCQARSSSHEQYGPVHLDPAQVCRLGWQYDVGSSACVRVVAVNVTRPQAMAACLGAGGRLFQHRAAAPGFSALPATMSGGWTGSHDGNGVWLDVYFEAASGAWLSHAADESDASVLGLPVGAIAAAFPYAIGYRPSGADSIGWVAHAAQLEHRASALCEQVVHGAFPGWSPRASEQCPAGWAAFRGQCVYLSTWSAPGMGDTMASFPEAERQCLSVGGGGLLRATHADWHKVLPGMTHPEARPVTNSSVWLGASMNGSILSWRHPPEAVCASGAACFDTGCSPAACSAAEAAAADGDALIMQFDPDMHSTLPPVGLLGLGPPGQRLPFACSIDLHRVCDRGGAKTPYRYFQGRCYATHDGSAPQPYALLEQQCAANGGNAAVPDSAPKLRFLQQAGLLTASGAGTDDMIWMGLHTITNVPPAAREWQFASGSPYPALDGFVPWPDVTAKPAANYFLCALYDYAAESITQTLCAGLSRQIVCEYVPIPAGVLGRALPPLSPAKFGGVAARIAYHNSIFMASDTNQTAVAAQAACWHGMGGGLRAMVPAPSAAMALWLGLVTQSAWQIESNFGSPKTDFAHYWLDYYSASSDSVAHRSNYLDSLGRPMGVDFWETTSPDNDPERFVLLGAGTWAAAGTGTGDALSFPEFTDERDAPVTALRARPLCEVPAVPPCPAGWRFMHDDVTETGIGPRCFLQLPGLWDAVNATAACRAEHPAASLLLVNSAAERVLTQEDSELPALVPQDTWMDIARMDNNAIQMMSSDGRPHGVEAFVANGSYDSWRGGDPNGKTQGGCVALDHTNYRWDIFACSLLRPAVCEMAPPAPVVQHPAQTLARPAHVPHPARLNTTQAACSDDVNTPRLQRNATACPPGFSAFPELQTCLRLSTIAGPSDSWLAAQYACSQGGGVRVAPLATAAHVTAALSLFSLLTPGEKPTHTLSAFIGVGDWGVEGSFSTFDGRPVHIHELGVHVDTFDQDDVTDCVVLREVLGRQAMLKVVPCSYSAPRFAVCERPMFVHEHSEYFMLPRPMDAPAADAACAAQGAHVVVPSSAPERAAVATIIGRFHGVQSVLTGLRGSARVSAGIQATSGEAPISVFDGILSHSTAGVLTADGSLLPAALAAAHPVLCERDVRKVCPHGWTYGEHFCWQVRHVDAAHVNSTSFGDALGGCAAVGGALASPSNAEQMHFLADMVVPRGHDVALGEFGLDSVPLSASVSPDRHRWAPSDFGFQPAASHAVFAALLSRPGSAPAHYTRIPFNGAADVLTSLAFACQRPAYLSSFVSCPQGWVPMYDRCILHSKQRLQWAWADAAAPEEAPASHVPQICQALGGTSAFIPDAELALAGVSAMLRAQGLAGVEWHTALRFHPSSPTTYGVQGTSYDFCGSPGPNQELLHIEGGICNGSTPTSHPPSPALAGFAALGGNSSTLSKSLARLSPPSTASRPYICQLLLEDGSALLGACASGWDYFGGECYKWHSAGSPQTFQQAQSQCFGLEGSLAPMRSEQQLEYLAFLQNQTAPISNVFWMGVSRLARDDFAPHNTDGGDVLSLPAAELQEWVNLAEPAQNVMLKWKSKTGELVQSAGTDGGMFCVTPYRQIALRSLCTGSGFGKPYRGQCYRVANTNATMVGAHELAFDASRDLFSPGTAAEMDFLLQNAQAGTHLQEVGTMWLGVHSNQQAGQGVRKAFISADGTARWHELPWFSQQYGYRRTDDKAATLRWPGEVLDDEADDLAVQLTFVGERKLFTVCPSGWLLAAGVCLRHSDSSGSRDLTNAICEAYFPGAGLATPRSRAFLAALRPLAEVLNGNDFHIGLTRAPDVAPTAFRWDDGVIQYFNSGGSGDQHYFGNFFGPGQPGSSTSFCGQLEREGDRLSMDSCTHNQRGMCQMKPFAPVFGTLGQGLGGSTWGVPPSVPDTDAAVFLMPTRAPGVSASPSAAPTSSSTPSQTTSESPSPTSAPTSSSTATPTPSHTVTSTASMTPSVTHTAASTASPTASVSGSMTASCTASASNSPEQTASASAELSPTPSAAHTPSSSVSPSVTPSASSAPSVSGSPTGLPPLPSPQGTPSVQASPLPAIDAVVFRTEPLPVQLLHLDTPAPATLSASVSFLALGQLTSAQIVVRQVASLTLARATQLGLLSSSITTSDVYAAVLLQSNARTAAGSAGPRFTVSASTPLVQLQRLTWEGFSSTVSTTIMPGDGDDNAQSFAGLFAYNVSVVDDSGRAAASQPLVLQVTAAGADVTPRSVQAQAAPSGGSNTMLLGARLSALSGSTSVAVRVPAAATCWLRVLGGVSLLSSSAVPAPLAASIAAATGPQSDIRDALVSLDVGLLQTLPMQLEVDLAQLPQGLHTAAVSVHVGDAARSTHTVSVSVLVSAVLPCPRSVQLPPATLLRADAGTSTTDALAIRNVAASAQRVLRVAVLPSIRPLGITQLAACSGNQTAPAAVAYAAQFVAATQGAAGGDFWLQARGEGLVIAPGGRAQLPGFIQLGEISTPTPGAYTASVAVLVENVATGAQEVATIDVRMHVQQGPVDWARSSIAPLQPLLPGAALPLESASPAGQPSAGMVASGQQPQQLLILDGSVVVAVIAVRDALGIEQAAGRNVMSLSLAAVPPAAQGRALTDTPLRLQARLQQLTAAQLQLLRVVSGVSDDARALVASASNPLVVLVPSSAVSSVPAGWQLRVELGALLVSAQSQGQVTRPVSIDMQLEASVTAAPCSGRGQVSHGASCRCAPGYARVPSSGIAGSALTAATLSCAPCPAGSFGRQPTLELQDQACFVCGQGSFSVAGSAQCAACPVGGVCAAGQLTLLGGYGLAELDRELSAVSSNASAADIARSILLCPYPRACQQGAAASSTTVGTLQLTTCKAGHEGQLCAVCMEGHMPSAPAGGSTVACARCNAQGLFLPFVLTLGGLLLLLLLAVTWLKLQSMLPEQPVFVSPDIAAHGSSAVRWRMCGSDRLLPRTPLLLDTILGSSRHALPEKRLSSTLFTAAGVAQLRFVALLALALHLLWSSQLDSYRSNSQEATTSLSILSHMGSIFPVQAWHTACFIGRDSFLTWSFAVGAALPALGILGSLAVAALVLPCLSSPFQRLDSRRSQAASNPTCSVFKEVFLGTAALSLLLTVPRSILSTLSVFVTVSAAPDDERLLGDFNAAAGTTQHAVLQALAAVLVLLWLAAAVLVQSAYWQLHSAAPDETSDPAATRRSSEHFHFKAESSNKLFGSRHRKPAGAAAVAAGPPAVAAAAVAAGPPAVAAARSVSTAIAVKAAQYGFRHERGSCLWRSLGWMWGLFSPVYWWYASAWLVQGIALALIALWPGTAVGRAYFSMCVSLIFTAAQLWAEPLSLPRDTELLLPYRDMPAGHVQRLKVVAALCNAMMSVVQCGLLLQGGFSYLYETALGGDVFSGSGASNPFLEDIVVHLPSVEAAAASALNFGFFAPLWLLLAVVVLPASSARLLLRLGAVAHRPCLSRAMAAPHTGASKPAATNNNPMFRKSTSAWKAERSKATLAVLAGSAAAAAAVAGRSRAAAAAARALGSDGRAQRVRFERSHSRSGAQDRASTRSGQLEFGSSTGGGAASPAILRRLDTCAVQLSHESPIARRKLRQQASRSGDSNTRRPDSATEHGRVGGGGTPRSGGAKRKGTSAKAKRRGFL